MRSVPHAAGFQRLHRLGGVVLLFLGTVPALCASDAADASKSLPREQIEFFESKIRPVLVERCYECHSANARKLKGGLLLDTRAGLLKGGDTGPAIVPGDPKRSLLIKSIRSTDEDLKMPPK